MQHGGAVRRRYGIAAQMAPCLETLASHNPVDGL